MTLTWANDANGNAPLWYIDITLTNNQTPATGTNFQCMVTINSNTNSAYYAADLKNVCFQNGAGNLLKSWLESGEINTSTASVYWVLLPSSIAGSGGTQHIYQVLTGTSLNSMDGSTTGAEPNYTGTYGQYDNGASIFTFYDNFVGLTLNASKWTDNTANTAGTLTINNSLSYTVAGANNTNLPFVYSVSTFSNGVYETYGTIPVGANTGSATHAQFGLDSTANLNNDEAVVGWLNNPYGLATSTDGGVQNKVSSLSSGKYIWQVFIPLATPTIIYGSQDYGTQISSSIDMPTLPKPINYIDQYNSGINLGPFYWCRSRVYPPSGVMPTATFGSITSAQPVYNLAVGTISASATATVSNPANVGDFPFTETSRIIIKKPHFWLLDEVGSFVYPIPDTTRGWSDTARIAFNLPFDAIGNIYGAATVIASSLASGTGTIDTASAYIASSIVSVPANVTDTVGGIVTAQAATRYYVLTNQVLASANGTIVNVGLNIQAPAGNIKVAIYSDVSGLPSALLGQSVSTAEVNGWNDIALTSEVDVVAGTNYWLAFIGDTNYTNFYEDNTNGFYQQDIGSFSLPNPIVPVLSPTNGIINFRMITAPSAVYAAASIIASDIGLGTGAFAASASWTFPSQVISATGAIAGLASYIASSLTATIGAISATAALIASQVTVGSATISAAGSVIASSLASGTATIDGSAAVVASSLTSGTGAVDAAATWTFPSQVVFGTGAIDAAATVAFPSQIVFVSGVIDATAQVVNTASYDIASGAVDASAAVIASSIAAATGAIDATASIYVPPSGVYATGAIDGTATFIASSVIPATGAVDGTASWEFPSQVVSGDGEISALASIIASQITSATGNIAASATFKFSQIISASGAIDGTASVIASSLYGASGTINAIAACAITSQFVNGFGTISAVAQIVSSSVISTTGAIDASATLIQGAAVPGSGAIDASASWTIGQVVPGDGGITASASIVASSVYDASGSVDGEILPLYSAIIGALPSPSGAQVVHTYYKNAYT